MKTLSSDWVTEGLIDFEYKRYVLLAYLQHVGKNFNESKLYPFLSELLHHYSHLLNLKKNKQMMSDHFPREIDQSGLKNFTLRFKSMLEDPACLEEVNQIIEFALPLMKTHLLEGKELYDFVESQLEINPVGLLPLYRDNGYLFVRNSSEPNAFIYEYQLTLFENANEKYKGLKTSMLKEVGLSPFYTYNNVKLELIKEKKHLPNPAAYVIESRLHFPVTETLLPVCKRLLIQYISQ